ncbi:MAG: hypothetical protein KBI44_21260 [Thermoanaerobaculia bacterium]|nr:hypothetical protein [Thermoanaerobaculia bacterium]
MRLESFTILAALGSFAEGALPAHAQSSARLEMRAASAATLFGAVLIFEDGFESEDTCLWSPGCAVVRINEVNGNIDSGCDLMELRVVAGGTMDGFRLRERDADSFTFTGLTVATNDLVVVHWNGNSATCNPNASPNETISITQHPAATFAANYDTAYDWYTSDSGITSTDNVLTLYRSGGAIADAVFVANDTSGSAATGTETQAAAVAAAGEWEMVGGGIPPGGFVDDDFKLHSAQDLDATGSDATSGSTIQRTGDQETQTLADWGMVTFSWGSINVGQADF